MSFLNSWAHLAQNARSLTGGQIVNTAQIINLKFNKNEGDGEKEDEILLKHEGGERDSSAVEEVKNNNSDELAIKDENVEIFL